MTTVQHRPAPQVGFDQIPSWVWIAVAAILAIGMGVAIGYTIADEGTTEAIVTPEGFEYSSDATPLHLATATPVTVDYMGNSGVLYPDPIPVAPVIGFETMHEVTSMHLVTSDPVTTQYFGYSGELYPAITVLPAAMGFDYDHEVTPMHIAVDGVTVPYMGYSGELFADD
ncbi:MAG: hypothetical protein QNJ71_02005 [Acidimicrobiia bacterium]|nr:hypothetical protein [Acidimicrobiia bacterium]